MTMTTFELDVSYVAVIIKIIYDYIAQDYEYFGCYYVLFFYLTYCDPK